MSDIITIVTARAMCFRGRPYPVGARVDLPGHEAFELVTLNRWGSYVADDEARARAAAQAEVARVMREARTSQPLRPAEFRRAF